VPRKINKVAGYRLLVCAVLVVSVAVGSSRLVLASGDSSGPSSYCGIAEWTIVDQRTGTNIFSGKADCTKVQSNGYLDSIMGKSEGHAFEVQVQYEAPGPGGSCKNGAVSVTLVGLPAGSSASTTGNVPVPEIGCSLSIQEHPNPEGLLPGTLNAVLARCPVVGGCAKRSDWHLIKVSGSFRAYYQA
jgi:hypothetical protein